MCSEKDVFEFIRRTQVVSGVGLNAFWISSYVWDVASLIPAVAFTLIVLAAMDVETLMDGEAATATVLLFVLLTVSAVCFKHFLISGSRALRYSPSRLN